MNDRAVIGFAAITIVSGSVSASANGVTDEIIPSIIFAVAFLTPRYQKWLKAPYKKINNSKDAENIINSEEY